jgi:hypothetical protein
MGLTTIPEMWLFLIIYIFQLFIHTHFHASRRVNMRDCAFLYAVLLLQTSDKLLMTMFYRFSIYLYGLVLATFYIVAHNCEHYKLHFKKDTPSFLFSIIAFFQ